MPPDGSRYDVSEFTPTFMHPTVDFISLLLSNSMYSLRGRTIYKFNNLRLENDAEIRLEEDGRRRRIFGFNRCEYEETLLLLIEFVQLLLRLFLLSFSLN